MKYYNRSITDFFVGHLISYPTPSNLNYFWSFGFTAGMFLIIQMLTGIILSMHYIPNIELAFESLEHIMLNYGWFLHDESDSSLPEDDSSSSDESDSSSSDESDSSWDENDPFSDESDSSWDENDPSSDESDSSSSDESDSSSDTSEDDPRFHLPEVR